MGRGGVCRKFESFVGNLGDFAPPPPEKFPPLAKANVPQDSEIPLFSRCEREKRVLNISQFITFLSDTNAARIYILSSNLVSRNFTERPSLPWGPLLVLGFPTPFGGPDYKLLL